MAHASGTCRHITEPIAPENFIYRDVNGNFGFTTDSTALSPTGKVVFDGAKMTADKKWNSFSYRPKGAKRDWTQYDGFRLKVRVETESDTHPDRHGYFNGYGDMHYHQLKQMADQTAGVPQDFYSVVRQNLKGKEVLGPELGYYQTAHGAGKTVADVTDLPDLSKNVQAWARGQYRFYMKMENENSAGTKTPSLNIELLDVTKGGVEIPKSTTDPKRRIPSVTYSFDFRFDNIKDPKLCNPDLRQWDKYGDISDSKMYTPVLAETATKGADFIKVKDGGLPVNPSADFLKRLQLNTYSSGRHISTDFVDAAGVNGLKLPKSLGRYGSTVNGAFVPTNKIAEYSSGVYKIYLHTNSKHYVQSTMPPKTVIKIWPRPARRYQGPNCYLNKIGTNEIEGYGVTAPRDNVYQLSISPYMRKERWIGHNDKGSETMSLTFSDIELYKCDYTCAEHKSIHKQKGCCGGSSRI